MSRKKVVNSNKDRVTSYFKLQAINLFVYALLFVVLSIISLGCDLSKEYSAYLSLGYICAASLISGFIAGIKERKNGIVCGLVSALPLNTILIVLSVILNGFDGDGKFIITVFSGLVSSAVGGIISVNIRIK